MSDQEIEQKIQAKGLTAPRVTPADIEAEIASEAYFTAHDGIEGAAARAGGVYEEAGITVRHTDAVLELPAKMVTICLLVLHNGFTVTGESACASPENFDPELGREIARNNAEAKIWPLLGYALRSALAELE